MRKIPTDTHWNLEHHAAFRDPNDGMMRAEHWKVLEAETVICSTQDEASARLIAAAPYLLAACREFIAEANGSDAPLTTALEWATHAVDLTGQRR